MSYIGATLYAPADLSIETFKERFEIIVQAVLDVNEPSAIGMGKNIPDITLSIRSVVLDTTAIEILERGLSQFYPDHHIAVMIQEVGTPEEVNLRPDFKDRLDEAVRVRKEREEEAAQATKKRDEDAIEQRRIAGMSVEQLRSAGYDDEAQRRVDFYEDHSTEPGFD